MKLSRDADIVVHCLWPLVDALCDFLHRLRVKFRLSPVLDSIS